MTTDDEIREIAARYERDLTATTEALRERRAAELRLALASGRTRADLEKVLEVSREGLRQMLDPAAARAAAEAKRLARARQAEGKMPRQG